MDNTAMSSPNSAFANEKEIRKKKYLNQKAAEDKKGSKSSGSNSSLSPEDKKRNYLTKKGELLSKLDKEVLTRKAAAAIEEKIKHLDEKIAEIDTLDADEVLEPSPKSLIDPIELSRTESTPTIPEFTHEPEDPTNMEGLIQFLTKSQKEQQAKIESMVNLSESYCGIVTKLLEKQDKQSADIAGFVKTVEDLHGKLIVTQNSTNEDVKNLRGLIEKGVDFERGTKKHLCREISRKAL